MGQPRLIVIIRHAQSEGNKNREIHQMLPDHRIPITEEGWRQAEDAGIRLRSLLKPDDTLQFFTSPYRRTRETTDGILASLTRSYPAEPPSPWRRRDIKVWEEPRLREQDFGNFQPCSAEMDRVWQERADYGHFFYRIPNGESAADAYDRVAGFNETLWRSFADADFPSVCVLVTHGLMTRVFLMKWYHWSVEYFEDLRNVNHCEFVRMERSEPGGKFVLQNQLRTWGELRKAKAAEAVTQGRHEQARQILQQSPTLEPRMWGGCVNGCTHDHSQYPPRHRRAGEDIALPGSAVEPARNEAEDYPAAARDPPTTTPVIELNGAKTNTLSDKAPRNAWVSSDEPKAPSTLPLRPHIEHLNSGRDFGGSQSGAATPIEGVSGDDSDGSDGDYFHTASIANTTTESNAKLAASPARLKGRSLDKALRRAPRRRATEEDLEKWAKQSGMGVGARADALGDEPQDDEDGDELRAEMDDEEGNGLDALDRAEREDRSVRGSVL